MSWKKVWTCDGCDRTETIDKSSAYPAYWSQVRVIVDNITSGEGDIDKRFDLCPSCQTSLWLNANPGTWPREART